MHISCLFVCVSRFTDTKLYAAALITYIMGVFLGFIVNKWFCLYYTVHMHFSILLINLVFFFFIKEN